MSIQHNQNKYLLSLVLSLIIIFTNCFIAWAESSSQVVVKEFSEQKSKPVVRPLRRKTESKYNVETGTVKIIKPETKSRPLKSDRKHGESVSSSNDKIKIEISPVKKISPVSKPKDEVGLERRREESKRTPGGESERGGIDKKVSPAIPIEQTGKGEKKFEVQMGTIKGIKPDSTETIQPPIRERIKIGDVQSWKLDASGNKTNEPTTDNMRVIEEINQPPEK